MNQYEKPFDRLLNELPTARRLCEVPAATDVSCVVAIAGFEPRCVAATERMAARHWNAKAAVCVTYSDASTQLPNDKYKAALVEHLKRIASGGTPAVLSHDDHALETDFGVALGNELESLGIDVNSPEAHIVVDITVGSSRLLLEGLHALFQWRARITLMYSEASRYRPYFNEYIEYFEKRRVHAVEPPEFLTRGVERVEVLQRIPGLNADARPAYLVMFPSFAFTRVSAVIDELAPGRVQWIFGIPHRIENRWRLDAQKEYHFSLIERAHRQCYVSTFDYRESLEVLERIYQTRRSDYSVLVASLGSKMQKLGQVLFHLLRPEVAAVVSIPRTWDPDRFSSEEPREIYVIEFGGGAAIRESLWKTRTLRV